LVFKNDIDISAVQQSDESHETSWLDYIQRKVKKNRYGTKKNVEKVDPNLVERDSID